MKQSYLIMAMAFAALLGALGQVAMKKGSTGSLGITSLISNWYLWGFAITYGLAVIINFFAYRLGGKVHILYPVIALSYVFAVFFSKIMLNEIVSPWSWAGTIAIIIGIAMIGWGAI